MKSWFVDARRIHSLEPEIAFHLRDELTLSSNDQPLPLELPDFPRASPFLATTREVEGHEAALSAYYLRLATLARQRGVELDAVRHFFWLALRLENVEAGVHFSFPWYDTLDGMTPLFGALGNPAEGLLYDDQDQGWALEIWARGDTLYLRESDPDAEPDGESSLTISVPAAVVRTRIAPLRERTEKLIAYLAKEVGTDMWTPRR